MNVELLRVGSFVIVGVMNTCVDFGVYNALTYREVGWGRIQANIVSTSVAMGISFLLNLMWVFNPEQRLVSERACRFLLVTAVALYGVQNLVIWLSCHIWPTQVAKIALWGSRQLSMKWATSDLIGRNLVKVVATGASLAWNYLWYRFCVFR